MLGFISNSHIIPKSRCQKNENEGFILRYKNIPTETKESPQVLNKKLGSGWPIKKVTHLL